MLARLAIERKVAGSGVLGALDAGEIIFTGAVHGDEIKLRGYLSTDRSKQVKMDLRKSDDAALFWSWSTNEFVGEF